MECAAEHCRRQPGGAGAYRTERRGGIAADIFLGCSHWSGPL